jgi:PAS domain-containing protein
LVFSFRAAHLGRMLPGVKPGRRIAVGEDTLRALERELAHYRALAENTSDWLWEVDAQGRYSWVSPRVKELLGYEASEVVGKTPFSTSTATSRVFAAWTATSPRASRRSTT